MNHEETDNEVEFDPEVFSVERTLEALGPMIANMRIMNAECLTISVGTVTCVLCLEGPKATALKAFLRAYDEIVDESLDCTEDPDNDDDDWDEDE